MALTLTSDEREELERRIRSRKIRAEDARRARVVLMLAAGDSYRSIGAALAYYDGYRTANLPSNLLQAQRDFFGAHTYERTDKPRGQFFHSNWTGRGGTTASTTYNV